MAEHDRHQHVEVSDDDRTAAVAGVILPGGLGGTGAILAADLPPGGGGSAAKEPAGEAPAGTSRGVGVS